MTAEQQTNFDEAVEKYAAKLKELQTKGLTKDKLKARAAKRKEARESGLKGKELQAHVNEGLSEEDLAIFGELEQATKTADQTVAKLLTDEQLAALPEKAQKRINMLKKQRKGGKGKGKKKKKKDAAAE